VISLDHIAFGARDARAALVAYEQLGFVPGPESRCDWEIAGSPASAAAACIVFEHEYLDVVESSDPRWLAHLETSPLYGRGMAPTGLVLSGAWTSEAIEAAGRDPAGRSWSHPIRRTLAATPANAIDYRFLSLRSTGLPLGIIADSRPEALRRPEWLAHPNTALGIERVHLRVPSVTASARTLQDPPLGLATGGTGDAAGTTVTTGTARICLHEAPDEDYLRSVSGHLPRLDRPALLAVEFRVGSLDRAEAHLRHRGVEFARSDRALWVRPDQGFGIGVGLRQT